MRKRIFHVIMTILGILVTPYTVGCIDRSLITTIKDEKIVGLWFIGTITLILLSLVLFCIFSLIEWAYNYIKYG